MIPLGSKLGDVNDAANLCLYLVSDLSKVVHGQTIGVDGGMMMSR